MRQAFGQFLCVVALFFLGCGAGPYSYSRTYVPNGVERPLLEQAKSPHWAAVDTRPQDFDGQLIDWFGVVLSLENGKDGKSLVRLSHAVHQNRHLCEGESSRSCRVTIGEVSSGEFSALLALHQKDLRNDPDKLQTGSLLHVFGKVCCAVNEDDETVCERDDKGAVRLDGVAYRHFPATHYVTPRQAPQMRR
ncbi:MAG: hypothetical protein MUC50_00935 [Myxococcota bacterium]|jgi:hypothetical protein|nr:hypothetical protein [Myxococcota bacterium]